MTWFDGEKIDKLGHGENWDSSTRNSAWFVFLPLNWFYFPFRGDIFFHKSFKFLPLFRFFFLFTLPQTDWKFFLQLFIKLAFSFHNLFTLDKKFLILIFSWLFFFPFLYWKYFLLGSFLLTRKREKFERRNKVKEKIFFSLKQWTEKINFNIFCVMPR